MEIFFARTKHKTNKLWNDVTSSTLRGKHVEVKFYCCREFPIFIRSNQI